MSQISERKNEIIPLSPSQQAVLGHLRSNTWMPAWRLADWTGYAVPTIRRVIQELRRQGFNISNGENPHNEGSYRLHD